MNILLLRDMKYSFAQDNYLNKTRVDFKPLQLSRRIKKRQEGVKY